MNRKIITFFILAFFTATPVLAIETTAKQAIVIDYDTGRVLLEKNADEHMPTSSMSKTMTLYMAFDALKKGQLSLDQQFPVSEKAWRMQGSKMFVEVGKSIKVDDLIHGIAIQSGNDAAIVLAEGIAGSEDAFVATMNAKAAELGMTNTHFKDASGWPDPDHYSTARDLATLARTLIRDFPEDYPVFAKLEFTYHNIKQGNRNPLLYKNIGADGIKTGHTEGAGYGLIGSGIYQGRRVIIVMNGLESEKARADQSASLLEWGLKNFENRTLFKADQAIAKVKVALGRRETVPIALKDDLFITLPKMTTGNIKVTAQYKEPLRAPVKKGEEIGTLVVQAPYSEALSMPLYAARDVQKLGFFSGAMMKAMMLAHGS